jgi:hypothetical protein
MFYIKTLFYRYCFVFLGPLLTVSLAVESPAETVLVETSSYAAVVETLGLSELAATFSDAKLDRLAGARSGDSAFALLVAIGAVSVNDFDEALLDHEAGTLVQSVKADPVYLQSVTIQAAVSNEDADYLILESLLFEALAEDITTGYNVTYSASWPKYAHDQMIIYGHNDLQHLRQLLFLLRTEGMRPEFRFVAKRSAFKIREEWGVADEATPRLPDGTAVAQITEYELFMEFPESADVLRFQELVTRYAKKDSEDEAGLIYKSWWQPFYRSFVPVAEMEETREIWVSVGGLKANILSIPDEEASKLVALRKLSSLWTIEPIALWVNPSFFRYLQGGYK